MESILQEGRTITRLVRYIQEHLSEEISLKILAEKFQLNSHYISQLFRKETDTNFYAYLTDIRLTRAKELLAATELPIGTIASQSGYRDYRVFAKVFHKREGITPSAYREQSKRKR